MGLFGRGNKRTEHEYVEEQLSLYLDGELLPEERSVVQNHLRSCKECQWSLETLRQTVQWTRDLPSVPVPRMFTIPVPAEPARAPRWRWSVPVFQAATALVAVLLFFVVAGDLMFTRLAPASEAPSAVMLEKEVVDVQMVEATVEVALEVEAVPAGDEAPPAPTEEPVAAEAVLEAPVAPAADTVSPTSAPQKVLATEPARIEAEIVSTPTAESSTMAGPKLPPPPEPGKEEEVIAETEASKPPPTTPSEDVVATETVASSEEIEPSPSPMPEPTMAPAATSSRTPLVAVAPESEERGLGGGTSEEGAIAEQEPIWTMAQPFTYWLSVAEIALAGILVLLLATTIILMFQRRRAR